MYDLLEVRGPERSFREGDEDQSLDHLQMDPREAVVGAIERRRHEARSLQAAVETVGPAVIGAGEGRTVTARVPADPRPPLPADVDERPARAVLAAPEDPRPAGRPH